MQQSFFNTINLSGPALSEATGQAEKQEDRVLGIIKRGGKMTPFQVSEVYNSLYPEAPVTSLRRSMTVLTKKGLLRKLDEMRIEKYGMKNHVWEVK